MGSSTQIGISHGLNIFYELNKKWREPWTRNGISPTKHFRFVSKTTRLVMDLRPPLKIESFKYFHFKMQTLCSSCHQQWGRTESKVCCHPATLEHLEKRPFAIFQIVGPLDPAIGPMAPWCFRCSLAAFCLATQNCKKFCFVLKIIKLNILQKVHFINLNS